MRSFAVRCGFSGPQRCNASGLLAGIHTSRFVAQLSGSASASFCRRGARCQPSGLGPGPSVRAFGLRPPRPSCHGGPPGHRAVARLQHCESRPHKSKRARGEGGFRRSHGGVPCLVSKCSNRLSALVSSLLGACLTRRVQSYDSQLESSPICYTVLVPGFLAWQPRLRASHAPSLALTPRGP